MKIKVSFKQRNSDYSQALADEKYQGKESEDNVKFWWEDFIEIKSNIVEIKFIEEASYPLIGKVDGTDFRYDIPNMFIWELIDDNGQITPLAISHSILTGKDRREDGENVLLEFIFTDQEVIHNPIPGVYMDVIDYPEALT